MKKLILVAILIIPLAITAQKIRTPSGVIVNDITYDLIEYKNIDSFIAVNPGWRVPTIKELQEIFNATYDKSRLRCAVKPGTYFSSDYEIESDGDTLRLAGQMYGKEFKTIPPQYDFAGRELKMHFLLLVKQL